MATNPTQYAHPEALVETDWLEKHLDDDGIRIVESNEDVLLYDTGHIPGAVHIDWRADLQDPVIRDYITPEKFAELCERNGITPNTTCIFYGDKANWWACYALWAFRLFGHENVKILNGGRDKWKAEQRPVTKEKSPYPPTKYAVPKKRFDKEIRAFADEALAQSKAKRPLIDVRSPGEFKGEVTHMPEYPQEGVSYSRCEKHAMENRDEGRQHIQISVRASQDLFRAMRRKAGHGDCGLLPNR
jgi:thiosulfate/3-mercaptopyruvate sulfurtransferase